MQDPDPELNFITAITDSQSQMRCYIAKILSNAPATDDVLQEANKVLWAKRDEWQQDTPFLKWAYRVCFFQAKAYLRDRSRERLVFDEDLVELLATDEVEYSDTDLQRALAACLAKASDTARELLVRRYVEGDSVKSLAERLALSPNALSQKLRRYRYQLQVCIENQTS